MATEEVKFYYKMFVKPNEQVNAGYYVYYGNARDIPWEDVPLAAVKSGDLVDTDLHYVIWVSDMTSEEYFAVMDS